MSARLFLLLLATFLLRFHFYCIPEALYHRVTRVLDHDLLRVLHRKLGIELLGEGEEIVDVAFLLRAERATLKAEVLAE